MIENKKIAIIDCDSILFSAAHPNKVLDDKKQPIKVDNKFVYQEKSIEEMLVSLDQILNDLLTNSESTHYIAYIKGKGNFRYSINPDYKGNRHKESPWWWKTLKDYLIAKWQAFEVNNIEVDDACNITRLKVLNSFISAIDKDLLELEGEHYNWRTNKWYVNTKDQANYKFWGDMICGQPGDNIQGIPGKGIKYVYKLFDTNDYDTPLFYKERTLTEYVNYFGEYKGIKEFYKNYISLKILEDHEEFIIPDYIEFSKNNKEWI